MRTLERITVTGYKSIRELRDFELGDLNVLIGANGAGKSNFLSLFVLLNHIANRRLQFYIGKSDGADSLLYFGRKVTSETGIYLTLKKNDELCTYQARLASTDSNRFIFAEEKLGYFLPLFNQVEEVGLGVSQEETLLFSAVNSCSDFIIKSLSQWRVYHFQDTTESAKIKQNANIHENFSLRADAGNLPAFLYFLKYHRQSYYKKILGTVRLVAPFFDDFLLEPMPENTKRIRLQWEHRKLGERFDISQLSDGTLRFICLTTLLLQPDPPSLIVIDEPELGLHPAAIGLLVEMLRSVTTKSQVIISTQSVSMVNQFLPEEIIVVDREKDESVFSRKSSKELAMWLDEYSMGELWEMNVIGGRP